MSRTFLDIKEKPSTMVSNTVASSAFLVYLSSLPMAKEARWWVFVRVGVRIGEREFSYPWAQE